MVLVQEINSAATWVFDRDVTDYGTSPVVDLLINGQPPIDLLDIGARQITQIYASPPGPGDEWSVITDPGITFAGGVSLAFPESGALV